MTPVARTELSQEAKQILWFLRGVLHGLYPIEEPFESHATIVFHLSILDGCFGRAELVSTETIIKSIHELSAIYKISFSENNVDMLSIDYFVTKNQKSKKQTKYCFTIDEKEAA